MFVDLVNSRTSAKRKIKEDEKYKHISDGLKIAVNAGYGHSNFKYSFFYDPVFTYNVTVKGQLFIIKLADMLLNGGANVISMNTDGCLDNL